MIRLFKIKEKEREITELINNVSSDFSNMSIAESANSCSSELIKKKICVENANNVFSIFGDLNIDESANCDSWESSKKQSTNRSIEGSGSLFSFFSTLHMADHAAPVKKHSAGELRLYKDISELSLPRSSVIIFPNGRDDPMHFLVCFHVDEGYYSGGEFLFTFELSPLYPHEAPKVNCKTRVYHPNIDYRGNVGLNILHKDWKPVFGINTIIHGLRHLFLQPDPENPLNHDAAALLRYNLQMFACNVTSAMAGQHVGPAYFEPCTGDNSYSVLLSTLKDPKAVMLF